MGISILGYGLHVPLVTHLARRYDGLTVTVYRGLSLGITMAPLLLFVPADDFARLPAYFSVLALASLVGALGFFLSVTGGIYLPIGISTAFRQAAGITTVILLGVLVLGELVTPAEYGLIALLLLGVVALALSRPDIRHLAKQNVSLGIATSLAAGVATTSAYLFFATVSREISPFLAGYFWELGIGVVALIFMLAQRVAGGQHLVLLPRRDVLKIAGVALLTIVGTSGYGLAINYGDFTIAGALLATSGAVSVFGAWFLFGERLSRVHLALAFCIVALASALQLVH
jgi:drug/metabolite transporter (DMT)-like permease